MTPTTPRIIVCPVCDSEGATLHHDPRATLVYSCPRCLHEWQVNPDEELELEQARAETAVSQSPARKAPHNP
jgi:Zn finger protein HypA/HybF involved in hydrogenase expression